MTRSPSRVRLALAGDHVAGPHQLAHALRRQPHVHGVVLELRRAALVRVGHQVDRLGPHHPDQVLAAVHHHALGGQGLGVEAAERDEAQEPARRRRALTMNPISSMWAESIRRGPPRPGRTATRFPSGSTDDLLGERLQLAPHDLPDGLLAARTAPASRTARSAAPGSSRQ